MDEDGHRFLREDTFHKFVENMKNEGLINISSPAVDLSFDSFDLAKDGKLTSVELFSVANSGFAFTTNFGQVRAMCQAADCRGDTCDDVSEAIEFVRGDYAC